MKRFFTCVIAMFSVGQCYAGATCTGKIHDMYKWASFTTLSLRIVYNDGVMSNWISLPTKSDEALALTAFVTGKTVTFSWNAATACETGQAGTWTDNTVYDGWFQAT